MDEQKILDAVREEAERYWAQGDEPVTIEHIWIDERNGDEITVKVQWTSESVQDKLRDDMVYTVTLDGDELYVDGPEW